MSKGFVFEFNEQYLRNLAGSTYFGRGEDYFRRGHVIDLVEYGGVVTATVSGTEDYQVKLWSDEAGALEYSCDCPLGFDDEFCKHCVATGLAWINTRQQSSKSKPGSISPLSPMQEIKAFLAKQEKEKLVEMLMLEVADNKPLREKLLLEAASSDKQNINLQAFFRAIDKATNVTDYIDYDESGRYALGVMRVVNSIEKLMNGGYPDAVIELCEHALLNLEEEMNNIDDSNGEVGSVMNDLQELHLRACRAAQPDVIKLAERLFYWEMRSEWEVFYGAVETYKDVFGEKGVVRYRELAEAEWKKVPALKPHRDDGERYGRRFRITSIMEKLAHQTGDIEAVVEVKKRDLSNAYSFLTIAELYRENHNHDQALKWAEAGVVEFGSKDTRLSDFLAEEYHRRKRHDEAIGLIWEQFIERPGLSSYQKLFEHSERANISTEWHEWREKALIHIRAMIENQKNEAGKQGYYWTKPDNSLLVEIFLWEKKPEDAWNEANAGGCREDLWLKLAAVRAETHPADSLKIYLDRLRPMIQQTNNDAYKQAIDWLKKIKTLMFRLDKQTEYQNLLAALRVDYKKKRNFMEMLNQMK
jgi:uncharacterized Zn finger protein